QKNISPTLWVIRLTIRFSTKMSPLPGVPSLYKQPSFRSKFSNRIITSGGEMDRMSLKRRDNLGPSSHPFPPGSNLDLGPSSHPLNPGSTPNPYFFFFSIQILLNRIGSDAENSKVSSIGFVMLIFPTGTSKNSSTYQF